VTREEANKIMRDLSEATRAQLAGKYSVTLIQSRMSLPEEAFRSAIAEFIYSAAGGIRDALVLTFGEEAAQEFLKDAAAVIGPSKGERN
jgi:hypothetical protein